MRSLLPVIIVLNSAMMVNAQDFRTAWPMINGDAARTSNARMNLMLPLQPVDTLTVPYNRDSGAALWDHKLYIGDYGGGSNRVIAFDLDTRDSLWSFPIPHTAGGMQFNPAVSNGILLAGGQAGKGLYGLDAFTGDSLWFLPVGGLYTRSPVIFDSLLYLCAFDSFFCANLYTGHVLWSWPGSVPQVTPAADSTRAYFSGNHFVAACNRFTGDTLWYNNSIAAGHFTSLTLDTDQLYVGYGQDITALNIQTGEKVWQMSLDTNQMLMTYPSAFAMKGNVLLVKYFKNGDSNDQFLLLDKRTGEEKNRYTGLFMNYCSPTIVNDYVIEFYSGDLQLLNLETGNVDFEMTGLPIDAYPGQLMAANDRIYVTGRGPYVVVLTGQTTAVKEESHMQIPFTVYPNPSSHDLNLNYTLDKGSRTGITIETLSGKRIFTQSFGYQSSGFHQESVSVSELSPGLYTLQLNTYAGSSATMWVKTE